MTQPTIDDPFVACRGQAACQINVLQGFDAHVAVEYGVRNAGILKDFLAHAIDRAKMRRAHQQGRKAMINGLPKLESSEAHELLPVAGKVRLQRICVRSEAMDISIDPGLSSFGAYPNWCASSH